MACVIELMEWQEAPVLCRKRFMALFAGRRAGKTDAIKARMKLLLQQSGFRYTYISPLSSQGEQVWREMYADVAWRARVSSAARRPYPHFFMKNGATLWFRSFQRPEGIRSTGESEICVDESQDPVMTENAIDTVIRPMLTDRRGSLLLSGQFRGEDWRYTNFYIPGQSEIDGKPNPRYHQAFESWRFPTSVGYCFQDDLGRQELELQRSIIPPAIWDQEWECLPRANANAVFPMAEVNAISTGRHVPLFVEPLERPVERVGYVCGVDMGRIVDPTKLVVVHNSGQVVYAEAFPLKQAHGDSARQAVAIAAHFRATMIVDATGGATGGHADKDSFVNLYEAAAIRSKVNLRQFFWSLANKERIIAQLALAIQQCEIGIPAECTELLKELKAYEYKYNEKTKHYTYGAPLGQHDDYVSALAMALEGIKRGWFTSGRAGQYGLGVI